MCDPLVGGIIGAIGSVASAGISYAQQSDVMSKQQQANDAWVSWQRQQSQNELAKDEANRQKAQAAQVQTLQKVSPDQQKQQQQTEQTRLTQTLTPTDVQQPVSDSMLLSGQQGAADDVKKSIMGQISDASAAARQRIAALATIQSYGGSQFGLQPTVNQAFMTGNQAIDLANNYRRGDLAAYQVAKNVEPEKIVATPSALPGIANALAGIAGKSFTSGGGLNSMFGS